MNLAALAAAPRIWIIADTGITVVQDPLWRTDSAMTLMQGIEFLASLASRTMLALDSTTPITAVPAKRRGRPPGSKNKASVPATPKRRGRPPGSKNKVKSTAKATKKPAAKATKKLATYSAQNKALAAMLKVAKSKSPKSPKKVATKAAKKPTPKPIPKPTKKPTHAAPNAPRNKQRATARPRVGR